MRLILIADGTETQEQELVLNKKSQYSPPELGRLLAKYIEGDRQAGNELFSELRRGLYPFVYFKMSDRSLAEDITQDALVTVLESAMTEKIRDLSKVKSFAWTTAKNKIIELSRRAETQRTTANSDYIDTVQNDEKTVLESIDDDTLAQLTHSALESLGSDRYRDILRRRWLVGEPKHVTCQAHSLSPDQYDRLVYKAKRSLLKLVRGRTPELSDFSTVALIVLFPFFLLAGFGGDGFLLGESGESSFLFSVGLRENCDAGLEMIEDGR